MKLFLQRLLMGAFFIFMTWTFSIAQVSLIASTLNVDDGDLITADIKVTNYTDIVATQFTLQWDSTVLEFKRIKNLGLSGLNSTNFNAEDASGGQLTMGWIDNSLVGVTLADSSIIFSIDFRVIGLDNETTPIVFTNDPTVIEVLQNIDGDTEEVDTEVHHGLISINGVPSNTKNKTQKYFSLGQNFPNPFKETTYIPFNLTRSEHINLEIYNNYGQVIYHQKDFFLEGEHTLKIDSIVFPSTGIYTIKLFTSNFLATRQLIFLN